MQWFMRLLLVLAVPVRRCPGCWLQPEFDAGRTNANPYEGPELPDLGQPVGGVVGATSNQADG